MSNRSEERSCTSFVSDDPFDKLSAKQEIYDFFAGNFQVEVEQANLQFIKRKRTIPLKYSYNQLYQVPPLAPVERRMLQNRLKPIIYRLLHYLMKGRKIHVPQITNILNVDIVSVQNADA